MASRAATWWRSLQDKQRETAVIAAERPTFTNGTLSAAVVDGAETISMSRQNIGDTGAQVIRLSREEALAFARWAIDTLDDR